MARALDLPATLKSIVITLPFFPPCLGKRTNVPPNGEREIQRHSCVCEGDGEAIECVSFRHKYTYERVCVFPSQLRLFSLWGVCVCVCVCVCVSDGLDVSAAWPRYRVMRVSDLGQYNLEILSADLSDDSLYECQAPDAALRSRRAKLTVLSKPLCVCVCVCVYIRNQNI